MTAPLLEVSGLTVGFATAGRVVSVVRDLSFQLNRGETLVIVGESGSGKSVTCLALMGLVARPAGRVLAGAMRFACKDGIVRDIARLEPHDMQRIRGAEIAMIFQEPMTSLNPVYTIGEQIIEALRFHDTVSARAARARAAEMLALLGIPDPTARLDSYPHELSGGMRQRAMIGMALACRPALLIADEPTTALDVTVQAQILDLLRRLQRELGMAMIFVTHNLGVAGVHRGQCAGDVRRPVRRGRAARSCVRLAAPALHHGPVARGAAARARPHGRTVSDDTRQCA
jgi:oligopeptide transport system ATP-binding protein